MAPQRGAKERADAAIVESVVGTEFGCEPVSTHRIILALRERGYGEHSRRMAGRWKRLMAKCVEFDESGDCLWTSRAMPCPHDNKGDSVITAVFRVKRTASGLTVQAEFTGQGPRGRKHTQMKRFRDSYGCASSKLQDWIDDWAKGCAADGIQTQYSIEVTQ